MIHALTCTFLLISLAAPAARAQVLTSGGTPDPGYAGFYAWFDPSQGVNGGVLPADGTPVVQWDDMTGGGHHLVRTAAGAAQQPTYRTAVVRGAPVVRFDGDDYIWGDGSAEFGTLVGPKTILVVCELGIADNSYVFDSTSSSGRNAFFSGQSSAPGKWHIYSGVGGATAGPDATTGIFQVHSLVFDQGTQQHFIDGVLVSTGYQGLAQMAGMIVGSRFSVSHMLTGDIAELLVYDELLSATNRVALEGYLSSRYLGFGTSYCVLTPNSTGSAAIITAHGSPSVSLNDFSLMAGPVPDQPGLFLYALNQVQVPFGNGVLCVSGSPQVLGPPSVGMGGTLSRVVDFTAPPSVAGTITAGSTWNFQTWFRDPAAGGAYFNTSNAVELSFVP